MKTFEVDLGGKTYEVDAPDPNTAWQMANAHVAGLKAEAKKSAAADTEKWAQDIKKSPARDAGVMSNVAANIGAGMNDVFQGIGQLGTDIFGSKEDSEKARAEATERRRLDNELADNSFGEGLGKYAAKGLQIAGGIAPSLVIPGGAAASTARLLPMAARAAATGAGYGLIAPVTEDGSRALNVAMGAGFGGATPGVAAGINQGRKMVTRAGGAQRAGQQIASELGQGAGMPADAVLRQTLGRLEANAHTQAQNPRAIPLSTAAELADPHLARIEAGSRARNGANWFDFDQRQARKIADEVSIATREGDDIASRRATRGQNWDRGWAEVEKGLYPAHLASDMTRFRRNIDIALQSPESSNPAVRGMLNAIKSEIDRLGDNFTAGHLQQIRANLRGSMNPMSPDVYKSAPRDAKATRDVLTEIDNMLDAATGGKWKPVPAQYAADSRRLDQAKAASKARNVFHDPETGRVRGVAAGQDAMGDIPKITEAGLGKAIDLTRDPTTKATMLSDPARLKLEATLDAIRRQNIVQGVKRSAVAGGGSNTTSDYFASGAAGVAANAVGGGVGGHIVGSVLKGAKDFANTRRDQALAEALQNPQRMMEIIRAQVASGQPLSPTQEAFIRIWQSSGGAVQATQ